jgi:Fur family transcriptional regulator, peroxide stress response regulator
VNAFYKYRNIGLKLTPQRLAILDYLEGNTSHPSAEDIYRSVQERFPTMSLATVYSTLAVLKEKGNVLELTVDPNKKRYDPNTSLHNHLICVKCKTIVDIHDDYRIDLPDSARQDFDVVKNHVEFYGFCPKCKNKETTDKEVLHVRRS